MEIDKIPIDAVIEKTGVKLIRMGSLLAGFCPLHGDKDTPSLRVYLNTNSWACFGAGCGGVVGKINGGDAVTWVRQRYGYSFKQAQDWLNDNFGGSVLYPITIPRFGGAEKTKIVSRVVPPKLVQYWHGLLDQCNRRGYYHSRGFSDDFINSEMWGWDGRRYVLPVWEGEPGNSDCLGVRRRRSDLDPESDFKYIGLRGCNAPTVWGRWHCRSANIVFAFAGEFDAARAVCDGFPAFSLVNGVGAFERFPEDWPNAWFPNSEFLIVVFDKKEERMAGRFAKAWMKCKSRGTARIFVWPPGEAKDYCEFRESHSSEDFMRMLVSSLADFYR